MSPTDHGAPTDHAARGGEPVTVTVARRVAPGHETDFEEWSKGLLSAASSFPGHLGAGLLRPSRVGEPWHIVFRFDCPEHLQAWEDSPVRARILAEGEELVHETNRHRVSGLETWFELPGRTAPAPPRWKMFLVSLAAIYTLQLAFNLLVTPLQLAVPLRVGLVTIGVTFLMTWLVMPWAARMLQDWLYAPPRRDRS